MTTECTDCPICFELISDPKILDCKHSMCQSCFQQMYFISNRCPICRVLIVQQEKAEAEIVSKIVFSMDSLLKHFKRLETVLATKEDKLITMSDSIRNCMGKFNEIVTIMQDTAFFVEEEDESLKEFSPSTEFINELFSIYLASQSAA